MDLLLNLDKLLTKRLILPPTSGWRQWATWLAHAGDGSYIFGGLGLLYLSGWLGAELYLSQAIQTITFIVLAVLAVVTLIKFFVRRQRPQPPGEFVTFQYDRYSFPSGHSARLAALAVSCAFFFPSIGWIIIILAISVALARVAIGIHYVGDILVGLGLGALVAWRLVVLLP
jgi:undecaprenyl-diphosphatase